MLLALGVPEEVVVFDYLRTNDFLAARVGALLAKRRDDGMSTEEVDIIRALMEVRPEYLATALDAMNAKYGSTAEYLREALGLDGPATEHLRSHLLE
jgi:protein-tyrosine phosphatase